MVCSPRPTGAWCWRRASPLPRRRRKRSITYADLAAKLSTTEAALKMAVQRLRHRYGELLQEEIANTVANPNEVEDELRHLMAILSG